MYGYALRSLLARRRRAALTAASVIVGVALVSATFAFTDTIRHAYRQLFSSQTAGADLVVSSSQGLYSQDSPPTSMPASLEGTIGRLPGVAAAAGQISGVARIIGRDNRALANTALPTLGLSYLGPPFTGLRFIDGTPPAGPEQVAIDQSTAQRAGYHVGDRLPIVTDQPARRFEISGIVAPGTGAAPGMTFALFDPRAAAALFDKQGRFDAIYVAAAGGSARAALENRIRELLPPGIAVRTSSQALSADLAQVGDQLQLLTGGLEAFGFVAMFVAAFVIFNTLAITVAQRARELALLRALGATRSQVLRSVIVEAVAVGAVASLVGLLLGLAATIAIRGIFSAAGLSVPSTGIVLEPRTIAVGLGTGIAVTIAAGLPPAFRATRVSPLQALQQEGARGPTALANPMPLILAVILAAVGGALVFAYSGGASAKLTACVVGSVMLVLAMVLLTPALVPLLGRLVSLPLERGQRFVATIARENAIRLPARTAMTASALMIGLALVLFVSVYESGVRAAAARAVDRTFAADFAIGSADGASSVPAATTRAVAVVPYVLAVEAVKSSVAQIGSATGMPAEGIDPSTISATYRFNWVGPAPPLGALAENDVLVEQDTAKVAGLHLGQQVRVTTAAGLSAELTVRGIYSDRALLHGFAIPLVRYDQLFSQDRLQQVLVKFQPGADLSAAGNELRQALTTLPGVVVRSERELRSVAAGRLQGVQLLFYALLAMSVVMALVGIVNALMLAVHERTRELGLLRAVGMTSQQTRGLIRDESVITAAIGTLVGLALGLALAWLVTRALSAEGIAFAVPWPQLGLLAACGLAVGVLGAAPAASRAARLDVLSAIAHE